MKIIFLNKCLDHRLPIVALSIDQLHYNFIVTLFNDLFGIQTRGGISCCGVFGELIKNKYNIDGWCRISFHWIMKVSEIEQIFKALEFISKYGSLFYKLYKYDRDQNLFFYNSIEYDLEYNNLIKILDAKYNYF